MKISVKLTAMLLAMALLAGCAGPNQRVSNETLICSAVGGLVGGLIGSASGDGDAAAGGAAVGAALGLLLCNSGDDPAPVVAAEPTVAPICTQTPPPDALLDAQGCAYDSDGDGVVDGVDLCANTPTGVEVDRVGCPLDSDRDGVADYQDLCPATPLGTIVDKDGCPLPGEKLLSLTGVNFVTNEATLTPVAKNFLEQAVTLLKGTDTVLEVRVEGHTDSRGTEAYNQTLSQKRAESVVAYLTSRGVNGDKLYPVGMGETSPIANNDTKAGQAANRRVDFVVR